MLFVVSCGDSDDNGAEYLFVQTSDGAVLTGSTLTLRGISPQTGWFSDRPYREAGQIRTEEFLAYWDEGEDSFADDPPNADLACTVDGEVVNYVVELQSPTLLVPYLREGCDSGACVLIYEIAVIGSETVAAGREIECDGAGHLFIDEALNCPAISNVIQIFEQCDGSYG